MTVIPEFTITRTLDAPRELVWQAWTEPEHLRHWLHPHGVSTPSESIAFDVRTGGEYRYTMINDSTGDRYPTGGKFIEVTPPERLVFSWRDPSDPDEMAPVATVTLTANGDRTEMRFHLQGLPGEPGDGNVHQGWDEAFDNLAAHLGAR